MSGLSVLIVESSLPVQDILKRRLAEFDCSFASSAYDVLTQVSVHAFDAYVLDYFMPDWSGPLLCREIRKHDPHSPVILCTERTATGAGKALQAGASAYIEKPIDGDVLVVKLRGLLEFSSSESGRAAKRAERAFLEELSRRGVTATTSGGKKEALARVGATAVSIQRTAHARAHKTFIDEGGTRARFDRWWATDCEALFPAAAFTLK